MSRPKLVQFGAGAIGRGFIGQLASDAGWETVFVDVAPAVLDALRERGGYTVEIVGPGAREIEVTNVRAVDGRDAEAVAREIASADLVSTAVGAGALPAVARTLARGIALRSERRPDSTLDVLICENLLDAAKHLRSLLEPLVSGSAGAYLAERVGLVETVISRMIPVPNLDASGADPLRIRAEDYNTLPVDASAFRGPVPGIEGLAPVENYRAHEERKLYAHNCGHALAAYLGFRCGHEFVWQAVEDPEVRARVDAGLREAGAALCARHGFTRDGHQAHLDQLLARFANRALGDTIARVGRDPVRKLRRTDRLVGAALLAMEVGARPAALAEGIAAAMDFDVPGDPSSGRLREIMSRGGPERALREICGLDPGDATDAQLFDLVIEARRG